MNPLSAPLLPGMSLTATHGSDREKLAQAARQFEAIFIRQMLGAARKTSFGEGLFGSQAMQTFRQMQDEKFADIAAERGAFGMAKLIEAQLAQLPLAGGAGGGSVRNPHVAPGQTHPPLTPPASGSGTALRASGER